MPRCPVFETLYQSVASGEETSHVLEVNGKPDYQEKLTAELQQLHNSEIWTTGAQVRALSPGESARLRKGGTFV